MNSPANATTDPDTGNRYYTHPLTGERFVSVTTILKLVAKDGLPYWAAKVVQEEAQARLPLLVKAARRAPCDTKGDDRCGICPPCVGLELRRAPDRVRDEAADRGRRVHTLAERYVLTGEWDDHNVDIAPYVQQYVAWWKQHQPVFDASEMTVISRAHGYAGTLDGIVRLGWCSPKHKDLVGQAMVMDLKTGRNVYDEQALQLAAYRHADAIMLPNGDEHPLPATVDTGILLHVRPDNYWVRPTDIGPTTFAAFLAVLNIWRWQTQPGPVVDRAMYKPGDPTDQPPLLDIRTTRADPVELVKTTAVPGTRLADTAIPF